MKKLLGIIASARKIGNAEIVTKAVAEKLGSGWELSLVRLPDISLMPCKGCYACILPGGRCRINDDTEWLLSHINEASLASTKRTRSSAPRPIIFWGLPAL